ncbi:MAG: hypothetical protein WC588_03030 [Candidatus Micrarchaeia archaeon]
MMVHGDSIDGGEMNKLLLSISLISILFLAGCTNQGGTAPSSVSQMVPQVQQTILPVPECPVSCEDGNPCTTKTCNVSTNYSCVYSILSNISCGENKSCEKGVCIEKSETDFFDLNITTNNSSAVDETIVHLENESNEFVIWVNAKRMDVIDRPKTILMRDNRLDYVAEKCNEEMFKYGTSNLTHCYEKYGSFTTLLRELGYYGDNFFFASETTANATDLISALAENLTGPEYELLTNQSIDDLVKEYPLSVDSIGASIDCDSKKCIETTIIAGNEEVNRIDFQNEKNTLVYPISNISKNLFVPVKYTVRPAIKTGDNIPFCELYFYTNMTYSDASTQYWWSDTWRGDRKHSYSRKISWTDYFSELISQPTNIFGYCWTEKTKGTVEISQKYIPNKTIFTNEEMAEVFSHRGRTDQINQSVIDLINNERTKRGYEKLIESDDLNLLARSITSRAIEKKEYLLTGENYNNTFGNSTYAPSYTLAYKGIYDNWAYFYATIENIGAPSFYVDNLPENHLDDSAKYMEYVGFAKTCDEDICVTFMIMGSNGRTQIARTIVGDNIYGYLPTRYLKMNSMYYPLEKYPNIYLEINSSSEADFYIYKNKVDGAEVWENNGANNWIAKDGWAQKDTRMKYYSMNLSPGNYFIVYKPILKDLEYGNFTFSIQYFPNVPIK